MNYPWFLVGTFSTYKRFHPDNYLSVSHVTMGFIFMIFRKYAIADSMIYLAFNGNYQLIKSIAIVVYRLVFIIVP